MTGNGPGARTAYDDWHTRFPVDTDSDTPWHQMVKAYLRPERDLAGKRVLEIGSGRGGFACWLASRAPSPEAVVAADFARTAVTKGRDFSRSASISAIAWEVGDIQSIAHAKGSFDTVISCETVEHLPDPARAIRELARVLKPGGRLFLTTPNYLGPMGLYRIYLRLAGRPYTEEGQPINRVVMLPRTLWWVNRAGLDVVSVHGVGHYLPLPGAPWRRFEWMDSVPLAHVVALHSFIEARKP
jgi:2-polyprenyl-3-methyl-5-hydroxy-6-metoxy-1,4-benzoquinol methylase